mmetsp:Transcript_26799/g.39696  ORF Transcript_26799/g.39696 Transcript_26799/m.39696 type:complete len:216 (+) Transcript_26799:938-1585(+)
MGALSFATACCIADFFNFPGENKFFIFFPIGTFDFFGSCSVTSGSGTGSIGSSSICSTGTSSNIDTDSLVFSTSLTPWFVLSMDTSLLGKSSSPKSSSTTGSGSLVSSLLVGSGSTTSFASVDSIISTSSSVKGSVPSSCALLSLSFSSATSCSLSSLVSWPLRSSISCCNLSCSIFFLPRSSRFRRRSSPLNSETFMESTWSSSTCEGPLFVSA